MRRGNPDCGEIPCVQCEQGTPLNRPLCEDCEAIELALANGWRPADSDYLYEAAGG